MVVWGRSTFLELVFGVKLPWKWWFGVKVVDAYSVGIFSGAVARGGPVYGCGRWTIIVSFVPGGCVGTVEPIIVQRPRRFRPGRPLEA